MKDPSHRASRSVPWRFCSHRLVVVVLGGSGVGVALIALPAARAIFVALGFSAVAWMLLLPRGWYAGVDVATRRVLRIFLAVRLVMPLVFHLFGNLSHVLSTGGSDSLRYHRAGSAAAAELLSTGASTSHSRVPGTGAIDLAVGHFYILGAPVRVVGDYAFNILAVIGILLFWWATHHLAGERRTRYTAFVLLTPTLLFWNAGISKEAVMTLATGCMVAGIYLLTHRSVAPRGAAYLVLGVAIAGLVRPHVALLMMASATAGVALSAARFKAGTRRVVPLLVTAVCLLILLPMTRALIDPTGQRSFTEAAYAQAEKTAAVGGRSSFESLPTRSVLDMPNALATVLLRPFPWEVRTVLQLLASVEATVIGGMLFAALWGAVKRRTRFLRVPLVVMSSTFMLLFSAAFASFGNLGLLVRERMQVLPFVIIVVFSVRAVAPAVRPCQPSSGRQAVTAPS